MSATIIPLTGAENDETPAPLCPPVHDRARASLTGAARRYWHRTRLLVEAVGWIVVAVSIIAAIR